MESYKLPFISEYEEPSTSRHAVKQYRPIPTRLLVLWSYLAATGICLALLITISQVERQTSLDSKRDVDDIRQRQGLFGRQDESSSVSTIGYTTTSGLGLALTAQATDATSLEASTQPVVYATTTGPGAILSLATQTTDATSEASAPRCWATVVVTVWVVQATGTLHPEPHPPTTVFPTNSADGCSSVTMTMIQTQYLLSLTSQSSSDSSLTPPRIESSATFADILSLTPSSSPDSSPIAPLVPTTTKFSGGTSLASQSLDVLSSTPPPQVTTPDVAVLSSTSVWDTTPSPASLTSVLPQTLRVVGDSTWSSTGSTLMSSGSDVLRLTPGTSPEASSSAVVNSAFYSFDSMTANFIVTSTLVTSAASTRSFTPVPVSSETSPSASLIASSPTFADSTNAANASAGNIDDTKAIDPTINADLFLLKLPTFKNYYYFFAMYLPKMIAVVMSTMWGVIFANLKLMEPFYQLSAHSGAFARDTMFGNYLSTALSLSSLSATFRGQWVLIFAGTILLGWLAVVALVSEVMTVISTGECTGVDGNNFRCAPGWAVNRLVLNMLIGFVGLIFIFVFILTCLISRRKRSGVFADPASLASMTELLGNQAVIDDLRKIDPSTSDKETKTLLGENRYKLGFYNVTTGKQIHDNPDEDDSDTRYGLIKIAGDPMPQKLAFGRPTGYGVVSNPSSRKIVESKANVNRRLLQLATYAIMLLTTMAIFVVVLYYYLDDKSDPLNDFFNNNGFGPRFVLTGLSMIITTGWSRTSQEVTLIAPYRNMARAMHSPMPTGVSASRSILAPTSCNPFAAVYNGLRSRNYMVAAVAISTILGDVLLIAISGVPFTAGQIKPSLQASAFTSLAILAIMAMTSVAVIIHHRTSAGGTRRLPRSPDTLVAVWLYLCSSQLVRHDTYDYDEQAGVPLDEAGLRAKYTGRRYAFAPAKGMDGVTRWTVDDLAELQSAKPLITDQETQYRSQQPPVDANSRLYTASEYSLASNSHGQALRQAPRDQPMHSGDVCSWNPHTDYRPSTPQQRPNEARPASPAAYSRPRRFESLRPRDYKLVQQYSTP